MQHNQNTFFQKIVLFNDNHDHDSGEQRDKRIQTYQELS